MVAHGSMWTPTQLLVNVALRTAMYMQMPLCVCPNATTVTKVGVSCDLSTTGGKCL